MKTYKNGNTIVLIGEDGTKIRYTPDNEPAAPEFPESIDMKITNCCDVGCAQCHECSTPEGKHADLNHPLLKSLHPYTELAIGGGDPMSHPDLEKFLSQMKKQKVFSNITVHWTSFMKNYEKLKRWEAEKLIYGIGISVNEVVGQEVIEKICEFKNAVVHMIVGLADWSVYGQMIDRNINVLLLGYKTYGRGEKYRVNHDDKIFQKTEILRKEIKRFPDWFRAVCFDNLAIEQLEIKRRMKPDRYARMYMGGDGTFTMYVDLVKNKYAVSSTKERHDIFSNKIEDLFKEVRKDAIYCDSARAYI